MRRLKKPPTLVAQPQPVEPRQTVDDLVRRFEQLSMHDRWQARLKMRNFLVLFEPAKFDPYEFEGQPPRTQKASGDEPWNEDLPATPPKPELSLVVAKPMTQIDRLAFNLAHPYRYKKKAKAKQ